MKAKSIFAASLLIAGAAFADSTTVETSYVLGVMPVSASGNKVILSIPWVAEGTSGDAAIAVTNLVKTAGLNDGDRLTWYDTSASNYKAWEVVTDGVSGVKYWEPTRVDDGVHTFEIPSDDKSLSQGQAIVLTRTGTSNTIYVIGQVGSESSVETVVAGNGKYTLVAPPMASGDNNGLIDLNGNGITWGSVAKGDVITVDYIDGIAISYTNDLNGASAKWVPTYMASGDAKIKVGRGFWYYRAGASDLTITWSAPSTSNN